MFLSFNLFLLLILLVVLSTALIIFLTFTESKSKTLNQISDQQTYQAINQEQNSPNISQSNNDQMATPPSSNSDVSNNLSVNLTKSILESSEHLTSETDHPSLQMQNVADEKPNQYQVSVVSSMQIVSKSTEYLENIDNNHSIETKETSSQKQTAEKKIDYPPFYNKK